MKFLAYAHAAGRKHGHPRGMRFFQNDEAVRNAGAEGLVAKVGDFYVQWPQQLGPVPTVEEFEQMARDYPA